MTDTEAFEAAVGVWRPNKKGAVCDSAQKSQTPLREQGGDCIMPKTHESVTSYRETE